MKQYELMMIVDPALTEDDRKNILSFVEGELQSAGAKILSQDHPGEQKLAYRIRSSERGYYLLFTLEKSGDFVDVSRAFNIKKDIWRYMFTRIEA